MCEIRRGLFNNFLTFILVPSCGRAAGSSGATAHTKLQRLSIAISIRVTFYLYVVFFKILLRSGVNVQFFRLRYNLNRKVMQSCKNKGVCPERSLK